MKLYKYNGITYKRTRKDIAFKQLTNDPARMFFIVGCNVNDMHFHAGWLLATHPTCLNELKDKYNASLEHYFNHFSFYLEPELGRYPVIYVEVK